MTTPVDEISEEDLHVELEAAVEQHSRLVATSERLSMIYAELDGYADGEFAAAPTGHLRDAQEHVAESSELMESEAAVVESRIEAIRERIDEVSR